MDQILCNSCMETRSGGDSRWTLVKDQKLKEQNIRPKYDFTCATCGNAAKLPFKPHAERTYDCYDCFMGKQRAETEEAPAKAPKHDLGDNVFIRKKK